MFGRDAGMAEAWLCSQEPLVRSAELGCTVDEVENLIKRHEAFQKSAVAWEERFSALEKLTAVRALGTGVWGRVVGSSTRSRCPEPVLPSAGRNSSPAPPAPAPPDVSHEGHVVTTAPGVAVPGVTL